MEILFYIASGVLGLGIGFILAMMVFVWVLKDGRREVTKELRDNDKSFREDLLNRWEKDAVLKQRHNQILEDLRDIIEDFYNNEKNNETNSKSIPSEN